LARSTTLRVELPLEITDLLLERGHLGEPPERDLDRRDQVALLERFTREERRRLCLLTSSRWRTR
jgi:hypothetical protein